MEDVTMEASGAPAENKMGVMPINKLILTMSLPMMASMLVQALYNIVDSVFVAQISENALTAVSLAFPMQSLMIAVATGTGVGVNALLSKRLGMKDYEGVNRVANNGIYLAVFSYIIFLLLCIFAARPFMMAQNDTSEIVEHGVTYLTIVMTMSFGLFGQVIMERLVQSTGKTMIAMITQGVGAVINLIFDPIMIFGYFGFPAMGVAGAALATVLGQIIAAILGVILNFKYNHEIKINPLHYHLDPENCRQDLRDRRAVDNHAVDRLGHGHRHEQDTLHLFVIRAGGIRHLLQAAELFLHAGIRSQQRSRANNRV